MEVEYFWGRNEELSILQMSVRAFIMFFIALVLIRIAGMRIFGMKSAFDTIMIIMLGSILARGVVGVSPFFSTVGAGIVMVVIHRSLAYLSIKYVWIGKLVKGVHHSLYKDGRFDYTQMKRSGISEDDIYGAIRSQLHTSDLQEVQEVRIEKSGKLSVVRK